jgi:hypothetical protein
MQKIRKMLKEGFEPSTNGFSIRDSTTELFKQILGIGLEPTKS